MFLSPLVMLITLVGAHFLCDYPLQGDFLSKAKNKYNPIPGVPWYQAMTAHCFIHATAVCLITGLWWLAVAEFVIHFVTDNTKCKGTINFNTDQAIHLACKYAWWIIAMLVIYPNYWSKF